MIDPQLLITGGVIAGATATLYQLKTVPKFLYKRVRGRLFYMVKVYQYDELFDYLEKWLSDKHQKQYRDVEATTGVSNGPVTPNDERVIPTVSYKQEDNTFILKYNGKKLLVNKSKEKLDKAQNLKDIYFRKYTISGIKAKREIDLLLKEVVDFAIKNEEKNTIKVYSSSTWGEWFSGRSVKVKPMEKMILPLGMKEDILMDVSKFLSSEDWYSDVSIPYKRGYCFYGPPGTGKTTLALALANYTKRNIYCLNLNSLDSDARLPQAFQNIPANSILLIEDIDRVFSGRDNVKGDSKITFSSLLNCLDGAFYKQGLITIITTNHIDKLDEALLRTGRMDIKLEVPKPTDVEISQYLTLFYKQPIKVYGNFDMKMSDIQEICLSNRDSSRAAKEKLLTNQLQLQ